jgi:hypothetical protein
VFRQNNDVQREERHGQCLKDGFVRAPPMFDRIFVPELVSVLEGWRWIKCSAQNVCDSCGIIKRSIPEDEAGREKLLSSGRSNKTGNMIDYEQTQAGGENQHSEDKNFVALLWLMMIPKSWLYSTSLRRRRG